MPNLWLSSKGLKKIGRKIFRFNWWWIHVFVFINLCIHFWILQCKTWYVFFTKIYSLVSNNHHPIHAFAGVLLYILLVCLAQDNFLKVFMCYVSSSYEKEWWFSSFQCALFFLNCLLLSFLFKQLSYSFQLSTVLDCPFD